MSFLRLPFFDAVADAETILLAGAGGGYDIFCGLPLYFGLRSRGKTVHLANLSFSRLYATKGKRLGTALVEVTADIQSALPYFPELHLARWLKKQGEPGVIYGIDRTGARPIAEAYRTLQERLKPDAVILVDGGTDSLMRGDEAGLGTPEEDIASIAAVDALDVPAKLLVCLGFGVDTFHGVCHAQFLEAVAEITRAGGFLGAWSLTREMPEVQRYIEAVDYVQGIMFNNPSIVSSSIVSAIEGRFGDHHRVYRTEGSQLFINALMTLYWSFRLDPVARRILYLDQIRDTETGHDLSHAIGVFYTLHDSKPWVDLPM
ncbi:MAG: DUF1152 domain-containing protein [Armatimonadetes bacterium]|nr:DUF1152 domain-containing protein [Armatimonadota bacterium]